MGTIYGVLGMILVLDWRRPHKSLGQGGACGLVVPVAFEPPRTISMAAYGKLTKRKLSGIVYRVRLANLMKRAAVQNHHHETTTRADAEIKIELVT